MFINYIKELLKGKLDIKYRVKKKSNLNKRKY